MGKMINFVAFLIVINLLFHFAGLIPEHTATGYLLKTLGITDPENFDSTRLWIILAGLTGVIAAGITAGLIRGISPLDIVSMEAAVLLVPVLIAIGWDMILLFLMFKEISVALATVIFSPLLVIYALTVFDWVRGRD